jgi:hypothetical protein
MARRSNGVVVNYFGADPSSPDLCIQEVNGRRSRLYMGLIRHDWEHAGKARNALRRTFEGPVGTIVTYDDLQTQGYWRDTFAAEADEQMTISGVSITAARITRLREGMFGTFRGKTTHWIDRRSGMLVKLAHEHINGSPSRVQPFQVTRLLAPDA